MNEQAGSEARAAAHRAGVTIRPVTTVAGLREVAGLFARVWDAPEVAPMPHDLMRSLVHAGGCVHAALARPAAARLAGASVAVFGRPADASCYSLITGVLPGREGRGVGLALKLAQRAWALAAGAAHMTWTFDPLLRRNAWFNLGRLGAAVTEYLPDFYGQIPDGVNDPETDRLAVRWDLRAPLPRPPTGPAGLPGVAAGPPGPAALPPAILLAGPAGEPVLRDEAGGTAQARCWIPEDILAVRRADPDLARRWRLALRAALGGAIAGGYRVTGLAEPGWYLLAAGGAAR